MTNWRLFRRWRGGKWSRWETSLPMPLVWICGWDRPGCGTHCVEREDWT